jgi:hypothetical protein
MVRSLEVGDLDYVDIGECLGITLAVFAVLLMVGEKGRICQNTVQELRPRRTALLTLWRVDILNTAR